MSKGDSINFNCPHCAQNIEAPAEMAGTKVGCPQCEASIQIPAYQATPKPQGKELAQKSQSPSFGTARHGTFFVTLFIVITGGIYCGNRLSIVEIQKTETRYEYQVDCVSQNDATLAWGQRMIEDSMKRNGGDGWDLKCAIPVTHKGDWWALFIYQRIKTGIYREAEENARLNREIEEDRSKAMDEFLKRRQSE